MCVKAGWATWSRVLLELKCWQCLFVQPCDMIYVRDTECKCPACDQQTKQQTKPEDQQNRLYSVFQPCYTLLPSFLSAPMSICLFLFCLLPLLLCFPSFCLYLDFAHPYTRKLKCISYYPLSMSYGGKNDQKGIVHT